MTKDIKDYLVAKGVTTSIYRGLSPSTPDTCITLHQIEIPVEDIPNYLDDIDQPRLQVKSRSADYDTAFANLKEVADIIEAIGDEISDNGIKEGVTINSTLYLRVVRVQSAYEDDIDASSRYEIVQNFSIKRRK